METNGVLLHLAGLQSSLQRRFVRSPLPAKSNPWQLVYLRSGTLQHQVLDDPDQHREVILDAPCIVCWRAEPERSVFLHAGSSGVHLAAGEAFLVSALGNRPESYELADMLRGFVSLTLHDMPDQGDRITRALSEISYEQSQQGAGQLVVIEAQLRCLLVHLWRQNNKNIEAAETAGPQLALLRQFRQLVESHFRQRLKVSDYALALNITPDRLHSITVETLERTPLALIHDRCHLEARALLTRTNLSLDQIAADLSFKSTPQFSAFFRKMEGTPPGKFRAMATANNTDAQGQQELDFSDWP